MIDSKVKDISAVELKKYMSDMGEEAYLLVDVREPKEYGKGHIPGAVLLPLKEVEAGITSFDLDKDLVFYCRSGRRSRIAANLVADMGLPVKDIFNLAGGILSWQGRKLPDFPRVTLFPYTSDISSMLMRAFELEKGTQEFYSACVQVFQEEPFSQDASVLAGLEMEHARIIYNYLKEIEPELEDFEKMYSKASGDIMEGGLKVSEALSSLKDMEGIPCLNFGELALDIEFMAYDIYKNLAARAENADTARAMLALSDQEKGHARIVSRIISRCPLE